MEIQIPKALVDVLEEIDRNARAYGWEVAKRDLYPPNGTPLSPENPFTNQDWRSRMVMLDEPLSLFDPLAELEEAMTPDPPTHVDECTYKYLHEQVFIGATRPLGTDEFAVLQGLVLMGIYNGVLSGDDNHYWVGLALNIDKETDNVKNRRDTV